MLEAKKGFRSLKAYKQLPALRVALIARSEQAASAEKRMGDPSVAVSSPFKTARESTITGRRTRHMPA
jgi:hypothetical protein